MIDIKTIFVIIDPSTDKQYALQRAMHIAKVTGAKLHAYLCISPSLEAHDPEALQRVERARYEPWLENIVEQTRAEGFEISSELDWSGDWRTALGAAAKRANADFIVKCSHRHSRTKRLMMTSSDSALLQTAHCSVQLVPSEVVGDLYKALIAVDAKKNDDRHKTILESVVTWGKTVSNTNEQGELHAVYAYSGSDDFAHVTDIARRLDIDTENVHIQGGAPEVAIAKVAEDVDAHLVIIGVSTRSALSNRLFGNIIDKLLDNVELDILVVIPPES